MPAILVGCDEWQAALSQNVQVCLDWHSHPCSSKTISCLLHQAQRLETLLLPLHHCHHFFCCLHFTLNDKMCSSMVMVAEVSLVSSACTKSENLMLSFKLTYSSLPLQPPHYLPQSLHDSWEPKVQCCSNLQPNLTWPHCKCRACRGLTCTAETQNF